MGRDRESKASGAGPPGGGAGPGRARPQGAEQKERYLLGRACRVRPGGGAGERGPHPLAVGWGGARGKQVSFEWLRSWSPVSRSSQPLTAVQHLSLSHCSFHVDSVSGA